MNISASTPISAGGWRYNPADPQDRIDFEHHGADELEALERNRGLDFTDHPARQSTTRERTILMSTNQPTDPQPTHGQPPVKAPKHKLTAPTWLIAISITLVALCCIGVGILAVVGVAGTDLDDPGRDIRPETAEPVGDGEPADEPDAVYHEPDAEDFELTVKTLSKECFGSAGCLIDFRIELAYVHTGGDLDPTITYEVTYEISGGESSYINTLTVTGDQYSTEEMESVSTASDVELGVEITDVSEL